MKLTAKQAIAVRISLAVAFLAATSLAGQGGTDLLASEPVDTHTGRGGVVRTEDGSWVPRMSPGGSAEGAASPDEPGSSSSRRVRGSFIVDLASGLDPTTTGSEIAADYGGDVTFVYDEVIGGFAFRGPDDARERMAGDTRIRSVEADYEAQLDGHTTPVERVAIRAPQAWTVSQGAGSVIAVIDTGVNSTHPQLAGRVLGKDGSCVGESGASAGNDTTGHGTAVAGHVFGHYGALPEASGYAVKVFSDGQSTTTYSKLICGINLVKGWASARGIQAASMSISGSSASSSLQKAVRQLRDSGVVFVASAGNTGGSVGYPAAYPEAVAVSALDQSNTSLASFSSRGSQIDMTAPGQNLTSLTLNGCCGSGSGTSFSTPQVAAAAALVKTQNPSMTPTQIVSELQRTGLCPPGTALGTNADGGNCNGGSRSGDTDGYAEPALNLEGAAKGFDELPTASFVDPTSGQLIRDSDFPTIRVSVADDDTPSNLLEVDIKVGDAGTFQRAVYNASSSSCPTAGTCHELPWAGGIADGPHTIYAQVTEPGNASVTTTVAVNVDNVDDPPTVSWQAPAAGALVGSPVLLRASAADDRGLSSVKAFEGATEIAAMVPKGGFYEATIALSEEPHTLTVVATDDGGYTDSADRSFTVSSTLYQQTFDTTGAWTDGWTESPSSSRWHTTSACSVGATSPPFAYFGEDSSCLFSTSSAGYLYSPVRTGLPTNEKLSLTFDSKEHVESCSGCSRDRRYVQVNYGSGWKTLDYRHAGNNRGSGVWESRQFLLNACTGQVQVRFYFDPKSSKNNDYFGWAIDNFKIGRTGQALTC